MKPSTRRLLAARLERARERIEDSPDEPSMDDNASAVIRAFRRHFGTTPQAIRV